MSDGFELECEYKKLEARNDELEKEITEHIKQRDIIEKVSIALMSHNEELESELTELKSRSCERCKKVMCMRYIVVDDKSGWHEEPVTYCSLYEKDKSK